MVPFWAARTQSVQSTGFVLRHAVLAERKEVVLALYNGSDLPQTGLSTTEACHNHTRLQMSTLAKGAADNPVPLEMVICISVTQEQIFLSCEIKKKNLLEIISEIFKAFESAFKGGRYVNM